MADTMSPSQTRRELEGWYTTKQELPDSYKLMLLSSLIERGHPEDAAHRAVYKGEWGGLGVAQDEVRALTCRHCGTRPYRTPEGRLMVGCGGWCLESSFGKIAEESKEQALQERVRQSRRRSSQDDDESPLLAAFGEVKGLWE